MTNRVIGRRRFRTDRRGITAMEYALIAFLVGVAIVAGATSVGTAVNARFTTVAASPALNR